MFSHHHRFTSVLAAVAGTLASFIPAVLLAGHAQAAVIGGTCASWSKQLAAYQDGGLTVPACGPGPYYGGRSTAVYPYKGAPRSLAGYQCVEFAERYLYYQYNLKQPNVWTNGDQVVDNYNAAYPGFFSVYSEGPNRIPVEGDVLSLSNAVNFKSKSGGHTAVVQASHLTDSTNGTGTITVIDENSGTRAGAHTYKLTNWKIVGWNYAKWLHRAVNPVAKYAGHIVQWNADAKVQKTSWYVTPDLKRLWIPDVSTYNCLRSHGVPGPEPLAAKSLDALPDQSGHWVACGDQMWTSRELRRGMSLASSDGRFRLVLQASDGNFVLYGPGGRALWASGRAADYVVMQGDGNLVGYLNGGKATWATNTSGSGANHLVVQSDGNLVLYAGSRAVWSTGTNWAGEAGHIVQWSGDTKAQKTAWYVTPDYRREWIPDIATYNCLKSHGVPGPDVLPAATLNRLPDQNGQWVPCGDTMATNRVLRRGMSLRSADGRYTLVLQASDGNFVLYGPGGRALWASGRAADFVVMQGDGNLVGYLNGGRATWATNTAGSGGNRLIVQNDGNVVIYSSSRAVWATNT
jgi:hypothetical protein